MRNPFELVIRLWRENFSAPGYRRMVAYRRLTATILFMVAGGSALLSFHSNDAQIVVYASRVEAGAVISKEQLELRTIPRDLVPDDAVLLIDDAADRITTAHGSPGQPVSSLQLLGTEMVAAFENSPDPQSELKHTMVPVKLAEPDIIPLLFHGDTVNIVSTHDADSDPLVIATGGRIVGVGSESMQNSETVLILLSERDAHSVASASLSLPLTVVLTGARADGEGEIESGLDN
ncbi:SAF domain-containing protein [Corynebacterium breve]|uniref:SAF domain-containing protein n=1 Tax=Corynebacterium breve TaxID=3049799 RepID=A0ABY8VH73_9CORY|nr:SAF domain-containing protein [Corynebacterium breve]WIM68422.1 SAF domain-containing protein [Corynebacterium breve]